MVQPPGVLTLDLRWSPMDVAHAWDVAGRVSHPKPRSTRPATISLSGAVVLLLILGGLPALGWIAASRGVLVVAPFVLFGPSALCLLLSLASSGRLDNLEKLAAATMFPAGLDVLETTLRVGAEFCEVRGEGVLQRWDHGLVRAVLEDDTHLVILARATAIPVPKRDTDPGSLASLGHALAQWNYPAIRSASKPRLASWHWLLLSVLLAAGGIATVL